MAGTDLKVFEFESEWELRVARREDGEPVVIIADVCRLAGLGNSTSAARRLDPEVKGFISIATPGGLQKLLYVTESGFYSLILGFRLRPGQPAYDRLKRFHKWVTSEVLPSIRKTGSYSLNGVAPAPAPAPRHDDPLLSLIDVLRETRLKQIECERQITETTRAVAAVAEIASEAKAKAERALAAQEEEVTTMTIRGYCSVHRLPFRTDKELARLGLYLSKVCESRGIPVEKEPNRSWGGVNLYPIPVLDSWRKGLYR